MGSQPEREADRNDYRKEDTRLEMSLETACTVFFPPLLFGQGAQTLPPTRRITSTGYDTAWPLPLGEANMKMLSQSLGSWEGRGGKRCA